MTLGSVLAPYVLAGVLAAIGVALGTAVVVALFALLDRAFASLALLAAGALILFLR